MNEAFLTKKQIGLVVNAANTGLEAHFPKFGRFVHDKKKYEELGIQREVLEWTDAADQTIDFEQLRATCARMHLCRTTPGKQPGVTRLGLN